VLQGGRWTIKLGNATLSVKQGDITRESTDAIVNSSNAQLQLDQGDATQFHLMKQYSECITAKHFDLLPGIITGN